jgi:hypothetical protein
MNPGEVPAPSPQSKFAEALAKLPGQKVRFYLGGGERGYLQGPVVRVDGNFIYVEKDGPIRGTIQTMSLNADFVHYFEIDKLGK